MGFILFVDLKIFFFSGSNDKSVIIWDVKGELDLNSKLNNSLEVSVFDNIFHSYEFSFVYRCRNFFFRMSSRRSNALKMIFR
jgi:hypothetical protein